MFQKFYFNFFPQHDNVRERERERERVLRKEKSFDLFMIGKKWLLTVGSNRNGWLKKGEP